MLHARTFGLLFVAALLAVCPRSACADQVRFHFALGGAGGPPGAQPAGERISFFGTVREPNQVPLRPTHLVTYRHAYTGQQVTVPVAFPEGSPRIEYRADRIIYNYGSYTVEAVFLPDGSLDMVYNSGFLRPL